MTKTEYMELNKPEITDFFSVEHQNKNMDLIDAELKRQQETDAGIEDRLREHLTDTNNPHNVTAEGIKAAKEDHIHADATTAASGYMSASDKKKIDGIEEGANKTVTDTALSSTSGNPVQNKVVKAALDGKMPVYLHDDEADFDADDYTAPAIHLIYSASIKNLPSNGGTMIVDGGSQPTQYFFPLYNGDNRIYTRYKYHGTEWMDWEILGLSTSRSTAITTAGTYALDAVENNASVSGTLANRIKAVEDTVGKVYTMSQNNISGSGTWKTSKSLSLPAGTYVVTRKGASTKGNGMHCGAGYATGNFSTSTGYDAAIYTEIITLPSTQSISMVYLAESDAVINLEINAVRIK